MKKIPLMLTTLLATATVSGVSLANIDTYTETNETDFEIQIKDVTKNYENIFDTMIEFSEEFGISDNPDAMRYIESMEASGLKIVVPDIKLVDLTNPDLSINIGNEDDNQYAVGIKVEIDKSKIVNGEEKVPLYEEELYTVGYNETEKEFILGTYHSTNIKYTDKNIGQIQDQSWMYDLSSIGQYLMEEISLEVEGNNYDDLLMRMFNYWQYISLFLIEGEIKHEWPGLDGEPWSEYHEIMTIQDCSPNKISVYGQRNYGTESNNEQSQNKNSLYQDKYEIATDTFFQKDIDKATPRPNEGAIAGIVIGSIAGIALIGGGSYWLIKSKDKTPNPEPETTPDPN